MKVILSGGGTGGHVNPALAIGAAIEQYAPDSQICYVGTPHGIENSLVPEKYPMYHVDIRGLRRSLSLSNLKTLYLTVTAKHRAKKILREVQPDLVVGTGGYVCWPIAAAAADEGIPCVLHESNAVPGLAVNMLERRADVIFVNFAQTAKALPHAKRVIPIGTPIRPAFFACREQAAKLREAMGIGETCKYRSFVLSFGGSLGAERLNGEVLSLMESYGKAHPEILFYHVAGKRNFEELHRQFEERGLENYDNLHLLDYLFDMPEKMAAADLVIARSGATTLSELAVMGKPSILIPSPNVTNDQQTKNARLFAEEGAARLLKESDLQPGLLAETVEKLLAAPETLADMGEKAKGFAVEHTEEMIYRTLAELVQEKRRNK